jgi:hypothetical protein
MKIYNKLVLDIESGTVLDEDSFEYSGPIAHCGGGSAAPIVMPSPTEEALNAEQLQMLKDQRTSQKELEPFILESMGYLRDATGKIVRGPDTAEDILLRKQLALSGYDKTGNKLTEEQRIAYMTDAEKRSYDLTKLNDERLMKAYNGELETSPALEEELGAEETQATEVLQRKLGDNWMLSTSGQNMMKQIQQKGNLVREEARRGLITSGEGVAASRANINALESSNRNSLSEISVGNANNKLNRMMGYINNQTGGLDNSLSMSSKLASERANMQNVMQQNNASANAAAQSRNSMIATGAGTAMAAAATVAAAAV